MRVPHSSSLKNHDEQMMQVINKYISYINMIGDNQLLDIGLPKSILNERKTRLREYGNKILNETDAVTYASSMDILKNEDLLTNLLERINRETIVDISEEEKREIVEMSAGFSTAINKKDVAIAISDRIFDCFEQKIGVSEKQIEDKANEQRRERRESLKKEFLNSEVADFEYKENLEDDTIDIFYKGRKLSSDESEVIREIAILRRTDEMFDYDMDCISKHIDIYIGINGDFLPIEEDSTHAKIDELDQIIPDFICERDGETLFELIERFNKYSKLFTEYYSGNKKDFNGYGELSSAELTGQQIGASVMDEIRNVALRKENEELLDGKEKNISEIEKKETEEEYGSL